MVLSFYTTNISVGVVHHEIVCAKVNKVGVKFDIQLNQDGPCV